MKNIFLYIFIIVTIINTNYYSHGEKEHHKNQNAKVDTFTIVNGDTIAINGKPYKSIKPTEEKNEPFTFNIQSEIFSHLHNKLVHFPIALGVLAFVFTLLNFKQSIFDKAILITVIIGFLFSVLAVFSGLSQSTPFENTNKEWLVQIHQNFGIAALFAYFVWIIFLLIDKIKKYAWIISLVVFILVLLTGFLGGVIAH